MVPLDYDALLAELTPTASPKGPGGTRTSGRYISPVSRFQPEDFTEKSPTKRPRVDGGSPVRVSSSLISLNFLCGTVCGL